MAKGERIRQLREKAGLTQEELANRMHTTKQTIYKYEKNIITNIPSDRIEELANILNSKPEYILGWDVNDGENIKKLDVTADILIRMETDVVFSETIQLLYQMSSDEVSAVKDIVNGIKQFSSKGYK